MHTICSPHGDILRIMVMKKQGVQAMVEFDNVDSARKAKQALNGCDVYSGCCTLKIEFAQVKLRKQGSQNYKILTHCKKVAASGIPIGHFLYSLFAYL